jgi:hypothetical protein
LLLLLLLLVQEARQLVRRSQHLPCCLCTLAPLLLCCSHY